MERPRFLFVPTSVVIIPILVGLKLLKFLKVSWLWVLMPLWVFLSLSAGLLVGLLVVKAIRGIVNHSEDRE